MIKYSELIRSKNKLTQDSVPDNNQQIKYTTNLNYKMKRTEIINKLIKSNNSRKYLEIGVWNGDNFRQIDCPYKIGVDPDPQSASTIKLTSDEFFKENKDTFDLIFIDGLHHADQVEKDIINSLAVLNQNGIIVCHDTNPLLEAHQVIPYRGGEWNGDCWKAITKLLSERSDLEIYTVDTDQGCTVIKRGTHQPLKIQEELTFANLVKNRKQWLNLITVDEFKKKFSKQQSTLDRLLSQYIDSPNNPETNFQMALYYDDIGQTASAVSYYLRSAERAETDIHKYECLIRASLCFNRQGSRRFTVKGLLQHAVAIMPHRPEAYYFLSRHYEHDQVDGHWTNCYMFACIGEKISDFNGPALRTWVDYPGKYGLTFQRALSSWHVGLCEESRDIFKSLLRVKDLNNNFKNTIINNLKWMNVYHEIPFDSYDKSKYNKFKHKFPGLEEIEKNYSEAYQDLFVLAVLNGKKNGTYLEIGAGSPFFGSNTVLLEQFGWKGHGFDINPLAVDGNRKNPCVLKDALTINYDELLSNMEYGTDIDYLQVDLEPASTTYEALLKVPFDKYRFRVITFEHDYYNDETKSYRDKSREYLKSKGYELLISNIAPDDLRVFEDWWVHPDLIDKSVIDKFKNTSDETKRAEDILIGE